MKDANRLPDFSLGWELEATAPARRILSGVELDHDGSVGGESLEYRSNRSIVFDSAKSLEALRHLATDPFLRTDRSCGFHVHIGLGKRSRRIHQWCAAFVTLARHIEPEAFAAVPSSRVGSSFCRQWKHERGSILRSDYVKSKYSCPSRYNWVNPVEVFREGGIRTIEVRLMGEVHSYPYLLAWVAFCRLMAMSAWAVMWDMSREQGEIDILKLTLNQIQHKFRGVSNSKEQAKLSVILAHKARLVHPYGNVLSEIAMKEKAMCAVATMRAAEQNVYQSLRHTPAYHPGDTVECFRFPPGGNMTPGRCYEVLQSVEDGTAICIRGDNSLPFVAPLECVRMAQPVAI